MVHQDGYGCVYSVFFSFGGFPGAVPGKVGLCVDPSLEVVGYSEDGDVSLRRKNGLG